MFKFSWFSKSARSKEQDEAIKAARLAGEEAGIRAKRAQAQELLSTKTLDELGVELQRRMSMSLSPGAVFRVMAAILLKLIEKENERDVERALAQEITNYLTRPKMELIPTDNPRVFTVKGECGVAPNFKPVQQDEAIDLKTFTPINHSEGAQNEKE